MSCRRLETGSSKLETEAGIQRQQPAVATQLHSSNHRFRSLPRITPVIADIRDADRIRAVFEAYRPEIVFHAAAHKHVPLMESNEVEARHQQRAGHAQPGRGGGGDAGWSGS